MDGLLRDRDLVSLLVGHASPVSYLLALNFVISRTVIGVVHWGRTTESHETRSQQRTRSSSSSPSEHMSVSQREEGHRESRVTVLI